MRFLQWDQIIGLKQPPKGQTRRLIKEYEYSIEDNGIIEVGYYPWFKGFDARRKWRVGKTIAVQRPDGVTVGRTPPIRAIRQERLGDISGWDCIREGIATVPGVHRDPQFRCPMCETIFATPQRAYSCLWNHCGGNWERDKDKQCWVLDWGER